MATKMWMEFYFVLLLQQTIISNAVTNLSYTPSDDSVRSDLGDGADDVSWNNFMLRATWATDKLALLLQPHLENVLSSANISDSCSKSLIQYSEGVKNWEPWAVQMADASAKVPSGLLTGTKTAFGTFEECLQVRAGQSFRGQFCMVGYQSPLLSSMKQPTSSGKSYVEDYGHPPKWISDIILEQGDYLKSAGLWLGTCIPSTCTEQDVYNIFSSVSKPWTSKVIVSDCQTDESKPQSMSTVIAKYILLSIMGACIVGTVIDKQEKNAVHTKNRPAKEGTVRKLLKCFSLPANSAKLFEKNVNEEKTLSCLNGMRFHLSMWVILAHAALLPERWRELKYTSTYSLFKCVRWHTIYAENPFLIIENFHMMSGFLMLYTLKKKLDKNGGRLDIIEFFLQKYFRIMPAFTFLVLLLNVLPTMDSGPIWNSTWEHELEKCQNSFWRNLLFIQNWVPADNVCMVHSWFLGSLMQTQIAGLLLMLLMYRSPRVGILIGSSLVAVCIWVDYNVAFSNKFPMIAFHVMNNFDTLKEYTSKLYMRPFNHFPSFVMGMMLSWIVLTYKDKKFPKKLQKIGWYSSITTTFFILYAIYIPTTDIRLTSLYYAFRNIAWTLSFSWIVYSCVTGNGGFLNRFYSKDIFVPLSRLSYCVYIFHPLVYLYRGASLRERMYIGVANHIFEFCAVSFVTLLVSFIGHIAVEVPFTNIYYTFIKGKSPVQAKEQNGLRTEITKPLQNGKPVYEKKRS